MSGNILNHGVLKASIEEAAKGKGITLNTDGMFSVFRADSTIVVAPIREFDTSPATELKHGVNSAYAYIDSPKRNVPAGFYTLRVSAEAVKVGTVTGKLEYVDSHGKAVKTAPVEFDIKSLTLPNPPAFPHSIVSVGNHADPQTPVAGGVTPAFQTDDPIIVCCPNGYCWFERPK